jgi:hypothetical protein
MRIQTKIEPKSMAEFQAAMSDFANASSQGILDIALKNAQLMCRESMLFTPPMGRGGKGGLTVTGQAAGMKSVERDIRKVFIPVDKGGIAQVFMLSKNLGAAVKENNPGEFRKILDTARIGVMNRLSPVMQKIASDYDDDRAFRKAKNYLNRTRYSKSEYGTMQFERNLRPLHQRLLTRYGGRFKIGKTLINPVGDWRNKYMVQTDEEIISYVLERQLHVGRLKAGWWDALMMIPNPKTTEGNEKQYGRAGVDAYIKAQSSNEGRFSMNSSPREVNLTISNMIGNTNSVADEADVKSLVLGLRVANINKDLANMIKRAAARAKRK